MHILFLTQILPYPPDSGPKVKTFHVLRYLSQLGYQISLASFVRQEEQPFIPEMEKICTSVYPVPIKRSRVADVGYMLRSQFTGRPFLIERDDLPKMRVAVEQIMASNEIDVIHADQLTMAQFAFPYRTMGQGKPALFFDAHNAVWTIVKRMNENAPFYMKIPLALEVNRVRNYEARIVTEFDHTFAVSEIDREALRAGVKNGEQNRSKSALPISVTPIAVDTRMITPSKRDEDSVKIMTLGTLYYPPNADGIRWFVNEVFPLVRHEIPDATLTVIGKNPPEDLVNAAQDSQGAIDVTGYVVDLDPYFSQSALTVIPVRAGGGIRVRILEAFARAMPVVTTKVGLEGIEAAIGEDVLVADDPASFAHMVVRLLRDRSLREKLSVNGRRLAENKYDWQVVLNDVAEVYQRFNTD